MELIEDTSLSEQQQTNNMLKLYGTILKFNAIKVCNILYSSPFPTAYNDVLSELIIDMFKHGSYGPIGENNLFNFLTSLKLVRIRGRKSTIEMIGPKHTFLERAFNAIMSAEVSEYYISNSKSIEEYEDRTGQYHFSDKVTKSIVEDLECLKAGITSKRMAKALKNIVCLLTDFTGVKFYNSFDLHVQNRYSIDQDHILRNFLTSIFHKANDYRTLKSKAFICYGIKTLLNIFTTNDIKRIGFDQDITKITSLLTELKDTWSRSI